MKNHCKIESNNSSNGLKALIALYRVLNTSMDYLLFESPKTEKSSNDIHIIILLSKPTEAGKELFIENN